MNFEEQQTEAVKLLATIARELPRLDELLQQINRRWGYEDSIYRFYHQSFKVFRLQEFTEEIVDMFRSLAPHLPLNPWFIEIVAEGTGKDFSLETNQHWTETTRPIVEAFFHARYFLEMVCKYGKELKEPPQLMPSGWAAVLELYGLR
jgi:chorismate mutase